MTSLLFGLLALVNAATAGSCGVPAGSYVGDFSVGFGGVTPATSRSNRVRQMQSFWVEVPSGETRIIDIQGFVELIGGRNIYGSPYSFFGAYDRDGYFGYTGQVFPQAGSYTVPYTGYVTFGMENGYTVTPGSELLYQLDFTLTDGNGTVVDPGANPCSIPVPDPLGFGSIITSFSETAPFRVSGANGGDPPTQRQGYHHCVVWADEREPLQACFSSALERDSYLAVSGLIDGSHPNARWLGTHYSEPLRANRPWATSYSPSIAFVHDDCDIDVDLTDTVWDGVIESTQNGCETIEHWESATLGLQGLEFGGEMVMSTGIGETNFNRTPVAGQIQGLRYSDEVEQFVYVALGDSFASGEGIDEFLGFDVSRYENGVNYTDSIGDNTLLMTPDDAVGEGNGCHRSLLNYAKLNAEVFEPSLPSVLVDRTCSGAKMDGDTPEPIVIHNTPTGATVELNPVSVAGVTQLDQAVFDLQQRGLTPEDVDMVTVSMGGNDAGFADLIASCVGARVLRQLFDVATILEPFPGGEILLQHAKGMYANCETLDNTFVHTRRKLIAFPVLHANSLDELAATFPNAEIHQINYPAFLPGPDDFPPGDTCSGIHPGDAAWSLETADILNGHIRAGIDAANVRHGGRFHLVDISTRFGANPICPADPSDQLINNIPEGVGGRLMERLLDPNLEPGIYFHEALKANTVIQCALANVPGIDCEADNLMGRFVQWTLENHAVLKEHIAAVDPSVPSELRDAAAKENGRGLFHPNKEGFETIACNVRASYLDRAPCDASSIVDRVYIFDGEQRTSNAPLPLERHDTVDFVIDGWDPLSGVTVVFRSEPIPLGTVEVHEDGVLAGNFTVPDAVGGVHRVQFIGTAMARTPRVLDVLVELKGEPVAGHERGVYQTGFEPWESVEATFGDREVIVQADGDGGVFFEVPVVDVAVPLDVTFVGNRTGTVVHPVTTTAGCGCAHGGTGPWWLLMLGGWFVRRRR